MSLQGNVESLKKFTQKMRELPRTLAIKVAERSAPALTELEAETFDASEDAYGAPWAPSTDGSTITLVKTGALKRQLFYVAAGSKLRVSIGVPYAKYQIGKRPVFPRQGAPLPASYAETLSEVASKTVREELAQ